MTEKILKNEEKNFQVGRQIMVMKKERKNEQEDK